MIKRIVYLIPNTLTLVSLFLGFSSIVFSIQAINDLYLNALKFSTSVGADPQYFIALAGLSIVLASIFDFLDGFSAHLLKASTPMGKQLDSLADFVSFGVSPAVLFFTITLIATEYVPEAGINYFIPNNGFTDWLSDRIVFFKLLAFILPICTVFRLAKFNLESEKKPYFEGLPSTYAGALLGIILTFNFYLTPLMRLLNDLQVPSFFLFFVDLFEKLFFNYLFLTTIYIVLAFLMVTRIRFYRIDAILSKRRFKQYLIPIVIALAIISALFFKYVYILFGIGYLIWCIVHFIFKRKSFT